MPKKNKVAVVKSIAFNLFLAFLALLLLFTTGSPSSNLNDNHQGVKYEQE